MDERKYAVGDLVLIGNTLPVQQLRVNQKQAKVDQVLNRENIYQEWMYVLVLTDTGEVVEVPEGSIAQKLR